MAHLGLRLWMLVFHRFTRRGRVTLDRPSLIVANHASHLDIAAIFCSLPLAEVVRVRTAAAKDVIFQLPRWPLGLVKFLFNVFPFERKGRSTESLERCERYLRAGYHVVIFPEGRRSPDGGFLGFTPGFAKVACRTGAPVVPLRIRGAERALPRGASLPVSYPVSTEAREPIAVEPLRRADVSERREAYAAIVAQAEERVAGGRRPSEPACDY